MADLDDEQIVQLLVEDTDTDDLDKEYNLTENIVNEIQSFQNLGDSSIFTG